MYSNSNIENDQFNRMQNKIKDTIDSMVSNNHIINPCNNSSPTDNNNTDNNNKFY